MNKEGCLEDAFRSKAYQRIYPKAKLDSYQANNECPASDLLVGETAGFHQSVLLGSRKDLDDIADAITKIYENRHKLNTQA